MFSFLYQTFSPTAWPRRCCLGEDVEAADAGNRPRFGKTRLTKYVEALSDVVRQLSRQPHFAKCFAGPTHSVAQLQLATKNEVFHLPPDRASRDRFFGLLHERFEGKLALSADVPHPLRVVFKAFNQKVRECICVGLFSWGHSIRQFGFLVVARGFVRHRVLRRIRVSILRLPV